MIANNISGKLVAYNSIKDHIVSIKILNNKNKIIECSKIKNKKLFFLTIGGKGRTGPIISAKLKLEKINSLDIFQEIFSFESYKKFFETFVKLKKYKYAVCWIDFTKKDFDGLIFAGKHINNNKKIDNNYSDLMLPKILIFILSFFISFKFFTIFFNYFFKIKNLLKKKKILPFNNFFFPQNKILNWNDLFKKNGFIQFQFYLKRKNLKSLVNSLKFSLKDNSLFSNFAIIKFHNKSKVSFNRISLSLDFPIKNNYHIIKKIINYHVNKFDLEVELSKDISLSKLNNKTFKANPIFDKKNNKYFFDNFNSKLIERLK